MERRQTKQLEMLVRVRHFGDMHRDAFARSDVASRAFAAVSAAVDDLTAVDVKKMSASQSARADRKRAARKALVDLLTDVGELAKVLRATGRTTPPFEMPLSRSDQAC